MKRRHTPKTGWNDLDATETSSSPVVNIEEQIRDATREIQDRVGMRGSLNAVRVGGMQIAPGLGMGAYSGGQLKSTIEPDGDAFFGSGIETPAGTSFSIFANAQIYNGELMEEGDALIGNNSDGKSNIKWDASEGQWQFRLGTLVRAYMDTDGTLKAGAGAVVLDEEGVHIPDAGDAFEFYDGYFKRYVNISLQPQGDAISSYLQILSYRVANETNLVTNGGFETGSFSSWTETDPSSHLAIARDGYNGSAYCGRITGSGASLAQTLSATPTTGIVFTAVVKGTVRITINSSYSIFSSTDEWRKVTLVVPMTTSSLTIAFGVGDGYIDDIVVREAVNVLSNSNVLIGDNGSIDVRTLTAAFASFLFITTANIPAGSSGSVSLSGSYNNYQPPGFSGASGQGRLSINATGAVTFTGWDCFTTYSDYLRFSMVIVDNIGTSDITFKNEDTNSTASNRFKLGQDMVLKPGMSCIIHYASDQSRWKITGLYYMDTDGTLAANSDTRIPTQKAVKTYVDGAVTGLLDFKGSTNCSTNPNYPAASKGDAYIVSAAGKIGGASGKSVDIGDVYVASADNAGGTEASVGTSWFVLEHNLAGALLSANNLSDVANAVTALANLGGQPLDSDLTAIAALTPSNDDIIQRKSGSWVNRTIAQLVTDIRTVLDTIYSRRETLTAARTYYVRTDGSDSNTGLANTSGGAFLTIQKAYDVIKSTLDTAGYLVTIQVGAGTYTAGLTVDQPWTGGGQIKLIGDETTPSNCVISTTTSISISSSLPAILTITGFKLTGTNGIQHNGVGMLQYKNIAFDAMTAVDVTSGTSGATVECTGNCSVTGNRQRHLLFSRGAVFILDPSTTLTHNSTPAYSVAFADFQQGGIGRIFTTTFTGAATGTRYTVTLNGVLNTGGQTLPGNAAGTTATGGQYA